MNRINLLFIKFREYILSNESTSQSVCFGALAVILVVISAVAASHTIQVWAGILGGFAFGIFLIKMQAIINYFKGKPLKGTN